MGDIHLQPFFDFVNLALSGVLEAVAAGAIAFVGRAVWKYLHVKMDDSTRSYLSHALENGISYAMSEVAKVEGKHGVVAGSSAIEAMAIDYALKHVPDALDHFGITPEGLSRLVKARMATWLPDEPAAVVETKPAA